MPNNVPGYNPAFDSIYNASGFDGQVTSDFLRLGGIPAAQRKDLIDFSTADFDTFKTRFTDYVKSVYPKDYNNFAESDLGQMLTELFAYMGAVMSFKADALAQENYLATAQTSEGVIKLLELIGIEIRGPVSSKATAQLTLESNPVTAGTTVTIPFADRTLDTVSTRDNLPLTFTLYKVDSNGNLDQTNLLDITLDDTNFNEDPGNLKTNLGDLLLLEGKLQIEDGTFKTGVTQQTIDITYPSVVEGSIVVSGTDGLYTEVENIFFASAGAPVFQKKYNDDYSCRLLFGDGEVGKAPTQGSDYKVYFRTGGGLRGNVASDAVTQSTTVTVDSGGPATSVGASYINVKAGTGGQDAQSIEEARRFGPMWFATQYRAVTGQDYTAYVNKFRSTNGKTGKGIAVLRDNGSAGNMIDLYVLQKATDNQLERASYTFKNELLSYMDTYKMLTDELTVVDGVVRTLDMVGTLYIDRSQQLAADDIKQRIVGKIVEYFSTDTIDFGTPLLLSELVNFIVQDPGARFFSIDNYPNDIYVDFNEIIQLNNIEVNVQFV